MNTSDINFLFKIKIRFPNRYYYQTQEDELYVVDSSFDNAIQKIKNRWIEEVNIEKIKVLAKDTKNLIFNE